MRRRAFFHRVAAGLAAGPLLPALGRRCAELYAFGQEANLSHVEARYYRKHPDREVECLLCPRLCRLGDKERGYCGVRENDGGTYYTLVYGKACSINVDPIEKKPFFHFLPGTPALSIASAGCNVNCKFCQNWEISQTRPEQTRNYELSCREAVDMCRQRRIPTIAYTYSEPVIFYEYMYDMAELGHEQGIKSVMVTGGYIEAEPLAALMPHLDAIKVDLKSIREQYYRDIVGGELKPVLDRLVQMRKAGIWLEIVYLVVPTLNDTDAEFRDLARWIKANLGTDVPLHFSRFHPQYLLANLPITPQTTLERAYRISRDEGIEYVYLGNLPGHEAESTYCPKCSQRLIERRGYRTRVVGLKGNHCQQCNHIVPGLF